jgi:demethylmenaquinone methyltransferase/2-methoxy-6-polyprenyl-1,4-benzoquinol methylase
MGTGSASAQRLMDYYWDTIERCVAPEAILDALRGSGFEASRRVQGGMLSEYVGTKLA